MYDINSGEVRWSVSLCSCSRNTAHFHYGNVILHVSRNDLRDLGIALQKVADQVEHGEPANHAAIKKGLVQ